MKEESKELYENQDEASVSFAEQYYKQLVSTEGWADEHIETKILTTEDHGARTVCLAPEKGKSGIIFKDIADFDKNGIDDLIVVMLKEYESTIKLDQSVYFFDNDGNCNRISNTNSNPITGTCAFYFYTGRNYLIKIYKEDNSGDWIDGLRYAVIDNNVQMHDDEIHIMNFDPEALTNGESYGEVIYIHKDFRYPDNVCYTIDDPDGYYAVYNRGFALSSADDRSFKSELDACDYINSLLSDILGEKAGKIEPTSWEDRWNTDFFPNNILPESYTVLKINASPSYKTGENTTESDIVIEYTYDEIQESLVSSADVPSVTDGPKDDTVELKVYTSFPFTSLGVDQTAKILVKLMVNGEQKPIEEFTLGNSNPDVIKLIETQDADGMRVMTFQTRYKGAADLTFTENSTGATITVPITIEDQVSHYRCSHMPEPDAFCHPIHVTDFQCTKNPDGTHSVKFNAYNLSYAYGVAVVYDENGKFYSCQPINPRTDSTGTEYILNYFWYAYEQTKYFFDEDMALYETDGWAMQTELSFDSLPENAKIIITADPTVQTQSMYVSLYTAVDVILKAGFYTSSIDMENKSFQETVKDFIEQFLKGLSSRPEFTESLLEQLPSGLMDSVNQSMLTVFSTSMLNGANRESVEQMAQALLNGFEEVDMNADKMLKNVLTGLGFSTADTAIIAAIPGFAAVDITSKVVGVAMPFDSFESNCNRGKIEIYCVDHESENQLISTIVVS